MRALHLILGLVLLASLVFAGARIYRRLPPTGAELNQTLAVGPQRELTVVFNAAVPLSEAHVQLYPIDFPATERDYLSTRRPGKSLEDFLDASAGKEQIINGRQVHQNIKIELDGLFEIFGDRTKRARGNNDGLIAPKGVGLDNVLRKFFLDSL